MPARNAEAYVVEAIESLQKQTFKSLEVIVVDGGSTDRTAELVESLAAIDPRIRLDRQEHTGIVSGRNRGAALARGEYLAWLDADDVALPRRLERQVQFMDGHPNVAALGGSIVVTDENLRALLPVGYPTDNSQIIATLPDGNALAASAAMIRSSAYRALGGCRRAFKQGAEDYDLWFRLSESYELANLPDLLARYRVHPNQVSGTSVERFVIPTVAAQLSALARRSGREDPYGELEWFDYDLFVRTTPTREVVDHAVIRVAAGQATFLALIGQPDQARKLLNWATDITRATPIPRETRAKLRLAHAVVAWRGKRGGAVVRDVMLAALLDPLRTGRTLAKGIGASATWLRSWW